MDNGIELGYSVMTGADLLFNAQMEEAYKKLKEKFGSKEFSFKDARVIYGKGDSATNNWLEKMKNAGVVSHKAKGQPYRCIE